ncbi:MAG: 30S ribosomal protein S8 [Candidatus Hydrogenedentota bacterium]|nr:MAG: 30S ribosomal protein S8 [Candidatus Hydrogenedentota bacterium]
MSLNDPIADALTRIRNAQRAGHEAVEINLNKTIEAILNILKEEGFIASVSPFKEGAARKARVELKYYQNRPVIRGLERVSKPGRRVYQQWKDIRPTFNNMGLSIYSTPKGVVSGKEAKFLHVGGEYICKVW